MPKPDEAGAGVAHYPNGSIKFRGAHLDGEMHGEWEFFRADGSRMRTGAFDRGKQIGTWRTYDRTGKIVKETKFRDEAGEVFPVIPSDRASTPPS